MMWIIPIVPKSIEINPDFLICEWLMNKLHDLTPILTARPQTDELRLLVQGVSTSI